MNPTLKTDEKGLAKTSDYTAVNPLYATPQALAQAAKIQGQPITSSSLANNQNPLTLPETTGATSQTAGASVQGITEGLNQSSLALIKQEQDLKAQQAKAQADSQTSKIQGYIDKLMGKGQAQVQAEEQAGISQKTQELINITNEYNTKALEYRRMEEAVMKEGTLTDVQKNARLREISRVKNTELADIGIRQAVAQNNLKTAQDLVDRKIDLEYGDLKDIIGFQTQFLEMNREDLSKAEQNALNLRITENQRKYDEGLKIGEFAKQVAANGADASTITRVTNAKSMAEAIQAAGQFAGDVLERQIKQQQLAKLIAETEKAKESLPPGVQTRVSTIANQFDNEPIVKEYNTIATTLDAVNSAGTTPTDDIQRVYAFAKIMDPNSVVREGEYKTVQEYAQALLQFAGLKTKRVFTNAGFLTDEARGFLVNTLNNRFKSTQKAYDNVYNEYGRRINKQTGRTDGLDYITDYRQAFEPQTAEPETFDLNGVIWVRADDGKYYPEEN